MGTVDTRIADRRALTEYGATLRERAAAIMQVPAEILATDAGRAALDAVIDASLGLRNAWAMFEATFGSAEAAGALAGAATDYRRARVALTRAIGDDVARRLGTDELQPGQG